MAEKQLVIIIPCFNEAKRLKCSIFSKFISENKTIDFYFVNDGSTDNTSKIIEGEICRENNNSYLMELKENLGKGFAIQYTLKKLPNHYQFYGFIDADLQIPLFQIHKLHAALENKQYMLAISSRQLINGFNVFALRSVVSLAVLGIANRMIKLEPKIRDTQCGCKLFKKEVLDSCFLEDFNSAWLFDIEILLRLREKYSDARQRIVEVPVSQLGKSHKSKLIPIQNFKIFIDFFKLHLLYN